MWRSIKIALHILAVACTCAVLLVASVVPSGIKAARLVHHEVANHDKDNFLTVSLVKQQYPLSLAADISITLEAQNAGKLPLSSRKMWLGFMRKQIWINIPELDPGARCSLVGTLPYPREGAITEDDKFVRVAVEATSINILGFYIDIEMFSTEIYKKTSNVFVPALNVLVISHKPSAVTDLVDGVRAFAPKKYKSLPPRPSTEEPLTGVSLHPLFALNLWEVASVEPVAKNRFYFEKLINGTWQQHTLYSLDNRLIHRDTSRESDVHVVLFVVPNDAPYEITRGIASIWNAAEAANKRSLLFVINGTDTEGCAAQFSIPSSDVALLSLNKSQPRANDEILRALHHIIVRGESSLLEARKTSLFDSKKARMTLATVMVLVFMLYKSLCSLYKAVRSGSSKNLTASSTAQDRNSSESVFVSKKGERIENPTADRAVQKSDVLEPPNINAQGNFAPTAAVTQFEPPFEISAQSDLPKTVCDSAQLPAPGIEHEYEEETSVILITLERLIAETTRREEELDITMDEDDESEEETNLEKRSRNLLNIDSNPVIAVTDARNCDDVQTEKPKEEIRTDAGEDIEEFEEVEGEEKEIVGEELFDALEIESSEENTEMEASEKKRNEMEERNSDEKVDGEEVGKDGKKEVEEKEEEKKRDHNENKVEGDDLLAKSGQSDSIPEQEQTLLVSHMSIIENYASSALIPATASEIANDFVAM